MATRDLNDAQPRLASRFQLARREFLSPKTWRGKRFDVGVSAVMRTDDEQKALYWQSRFEVDGVIKKIPGTRHVTYLDGVQNKSKHQANKYGNSEAIDFFLINKKTGKADWTTRIAYFVFGKFCEKHGLEWGGRFKGFPDLGHVQLSDNWDSID